MKFRNIFWGIILVFIGTLGILNNLNVIDFSWHKLWALWPVVLILWGISILPVKDFLKTLLVVVTLLLSVFYISTEAVNNNSFSSHFRWNFHNDNYYDDDDESYNYEEDNDSLIAGNSGSFLIPFPENIKTATLIVDAVAGEFDLRDSTTNLATFKINNKYLARKYTYFVKTQGDNAKVNITFKKHENVKLGHNKGKAVLKLNSKPVWDLQFNAGAADLEMDLSAFKVKKVDIDAGAANIDVKIGDKLKKVNVDIDAGASSITLRIPKNAACVVDVDTFLSDKTFEGFEKRDGKYYSENYENNDTVVKISIDSAVSDVNIKRY